MLLCTQECLHPLTATKYLSLHRAKTFINLSLESFVDSTIFHTQGINCSCFCNSDFCCFHVLEVNGSDQTTSIKCVGCCSWGTISIRCLGCCSWRGECCGLLLLHTGIIIAARATGLHLERQRDDVKRTVCVVAMCSGWWLLFFM